MMTDFAALYDARYNAGGEELINRIEGCVAYVAQYILIEDVATASHAERLAWAKQVLLNNSSRSMAQSMAWAVIANATIAARLAAGTAVPDSDIEYVISVSAAIWGAQLV
jgi:hypothetical protein